MKCYSAQIEHALRVAFHEHAGQRRKSDPELPYMTHLLHVAMIVQAHDFSEDIVIAALLHDTIEDTRYTTEELAADFGDTVCSYVMEVTENKALRWENRKQAYLEGIRHGSVGAKAICCADKIHNLSSLLEAEARQGEQLWTVFTRGRERTIRFYHDALTAISTGWNHPIISCYENVLASATPDI